MNVLGQPMLKTILKIIKSFKTIQQLTQNKRNIYLITKSIKVITTIVIVLEVN